MSRFPETVRFRAPQDSLAAIENAARQRRTTSAEWLRQTVFWQLTIEGIAIPDRQDVTRVDTERCSA